MQEIVDDDRIGRLVDLGDERGGAQASTALAEALSGALALSRDPLTPGRCRQSAGRFSSATCVDAYESLYRDLIARRRALR